MTKYPLWEEGAPGPLTETPSITHYELLFPGTRAAVIILPGGGYAMRARHEGEGYANFFSTLGITAFVVDYRVAPAEFPYPLLDARRAIRFVRKNAEKFGIDKDKIAVMGSSAGGHLSALLSTYRDAIDGEGVDELDQEDFIPNAQILCYPVISGDEEIAHTGSYQNLLGTRYKDRMQYSPDLLVTKETPEAFIWHTANDGSVNVINSYRYATALRNASVPTEMHIFPNAPHGVGTAQLRPHVAQWMPLLANWLGYIGFIEDHSHD